MKIKYHILLFLSALSIGAQAGAIQEANEQLRSIFSHLHRPHPSVRIFYDMVAHRVDSTFYNVMCPDTTSCDMWYYLYEEVYNSAYDTTTFLTPNDVLDYAYSKRIDTLCLGMIDLQYTYLLPGVLNNNFYFNFDIDNNVLYDSVEYTISSGPYGVGEVFMTAPLLRSSETLTPIFELSPNTIFWDDSTRVEDIKSLRCRIDLGDGMGWNYVNPLMQNYISADYPSKGIYYITTEFVNNNDEVVKHSTSSVFIHDTKVYEDVNYIECNDVPDGLLVYEVQPECTYVGNDKYVFVLAGYNPWSIVNHGIRTFDQLYEKYIDAGNHEILREYGYTIVLVDWKNHNDYLQSNAMRFAELLEQYKCKQRGDEEFVVIGHSMGSLIGRYALTWMESDHYDARHQCKLEKRHNTRLFISNDGPHQGVNIPLSLQWLYGNIFADATFMSAASDFLNVITIGNLNLSTTLLKGNSVKQMLYYHYSTEDNGEYFAHDLHKDFLEDIQSIGNYPRYCKLVAQSNGSLEGNHQQQYFSDNKRHPGAFRSLNDILADAELSGSFTILGRSVGMSTNVLLRTNPLGIGNLGEVGIKIIHPSIRVYWFGISITNVVDYYSIEKDVQNAIPYCYLPGGNKYGNMPGQNYINVDIPILGGFHLDTNNGCIFESGYIGMPWFYNFSENFRFCTNGLGFCFVPTVSAFDFQHNGFSEMCPDYINMNKPTLFSKTPFDVLIGQYANDTTRRFNEDHERIINRDVRYGLPMTSYQYYSCTDTVKIVNRIIGDEDLWLNNMDKPWDATYSAERHIYVNVPEDFLFHENVSSIVDTRVGAFTRDNLFNASSTESFEFQSSELPTIIKFKGETHWSEGGLRDCIDEDTKPQNQSPQKVVSQSIEQEVAINTNGQSLNVTSQKTISSIEIYTIHGHLLRQYIPEQENCHTISLQMPQGNIALIVIRYSDGSAYNQKILK